jgi:hypothetical protein
MNSPTLLSNGDAIERSTWSALKNFFPHYEDFWRLHLYPLRSTGSIHLRRGLDEAFEFLAMYHYSAYVSLVRAHEKIQSQGKEVLFPDDVYWNLSRAAELALDVVKTFSGIYEDCMGHRPNVHTGPLDRILERIRGYRNLIHKPIHGVGTDSEKRRQIPRPEKLTNYPKWSDTLYHARPEDFVGVEMQLNNDFCALCSSLESAWTDMCNLSESLTANGRYSERRSAGESVSFVVQSSASRSTVAVSSTATQVRLISANQEDPDIS